MIVGRHAVSIIIEFKSGPYSIRISKANSDSSWRKSFLVVFFFSFILRFIIGSVEKCRLIQFGRKQFVKFRTDEFRDDYDAVSSNSTDYWTRYNGFELLCEYYFVALVFFLLLL